MRITIEPTNFNANSNMRTVMESYSDDLDLHTVMTDLIAPALIGWGFHPASVYEYIEQDYSDKKKNEDIYDEPAKPILSSNDRCNWDIPEWK